MRILIDTSTWTTTGIAKGLSDSGFLTTLCDSSDDLIEFAHTAHQDLIVVDLDLAELTPIDALWKLRDAAPNTPIVFVTPNPDPATTVHLLTAGADAVLDSSAPREETVARIGAIARRAAGLASPRLVLGDLTLDLISRVAFTDRGCIPLSPKEYEVLEHLALNRTSLVSKDALLTHLYAYSEEPGARIIDVYVCKIRQKLAQSGCSDVTIDTVWGAGYRLATPATPVAPRMPVPDLPRRRTAELHQLPMAA